MASGPSLNPSILRPRSGQPGSQQVLLLAYSGCSRRARNGRIEHPLIRTRDELLARGEDTASVGEAYDRALDELADELGVEL